MPLSWVANLFVCWTLCAMVPVQDKEVCIPVHQHYGTLLSSLLCVMHGRVFTARLMQQHGNAAGRAVGLTCSICRVSSARKSKTFEVYDFPADFFVSLYVPCMYFFNCFIKKRRKTVRLFISQVLSQHSSSHPNNPTCTSYFPLTIQTLYTMNMPVPQHSSNHFSERLLAT